MENVITLGKLIGLLFCLLLYLGEEFPVPSHFSAGDKKLTRPCRYIQCKHVIVAPDHAPIKVDGSHNRNSGIDERAIVKSDLSYY